MLKFTNMNINNGKQKGIPFHKWKDEKVVKEKKNLMRGTFDEILSDPKSDKQTKKFAKNIIRVGLK